MKFLFWNLTHIYLLKTALISEIVCNDKISIVQSLSGKRIQQKLFFSYIQNAIQTHNFPHFLPLDFFLLVLRHRCCRFFFILVQCIFEMNFVHERLSKSVYCAATSARNQISLDMAQLSRIVIIFTTLSCDTRFNFFPCFKTCCMHAIAMNILFFGEPLHFSAHMCSYSLQFFECMSESWALFKIEKKTRRKNRQKERKLKYAF